MPRYRVDGVRYAPEPERRQLSMESTTVDGLVLLVVQGEIDLATAPRFEAGLTAALAGTFDAVRIDFGAVRFLDSTGVEVLMRGYTFALAHGAGFTVVNLQPLVRRVLEVLGLQKLLAPDD